MAHSLSQRDDYFELEQPRPESKETDAYWKKKPKPKKVKKKRRK